MNAFANASPMSVACCLPSAFKFRCVVHSVRSKPSGSPPPGANAWRMISTSALGPLRYSARLQLLVSTHVRVILSAPVVLDAAEAVEPAEPRPREAANAKGTAIATAIRLARPHISAGHAHFLLLGMLSTAPAVCMVVSAGWACVGMTAASTQLRAGTQLAPAAAAG